MFKLKESDYKALYPMAKRLFEDKYNTPYLSESFRTNIGKRALVEMLFLEEEDGAHIGGSNRQFYLEYQTKLLTAVNDGILSPQEATRKYKQILKQEEKTDRALDNIYKASQEEGFFKKIFNYIKKKHAATMNSKRKGLISLLAEIYKYAFTHPVKFVTLAGITVMVLAFLLSPKLRKKALTFARNIFSATPDEAKAALNSAVGNVA